ncbi:MAG: tyrosine-type recombinase/integrase [Desulfobacula sp.]|nr:tyrosine-type recombinase/integrase [Desulfobacula sp.]MBT3485699.1 tyrosine-type recombinase/integrase [Desulfobacula sp.]MBT3804871.1 tyrosine-type recombinase/integrase [Desulfobacula sp.]MBT4026597.1 tyrosine-type recombinase/integrase [Desulfobacula sp.]MBT4200430.1 tyrosine-type recombinase/integrase [Desulfobacula sp.]
MDFLEAEYGITVYRKLTQKNKRCARAINLLSDYLLHGIIFPRTKQAIRTYHPSFQLLFQGYIDKKRADGLSEKTLKSYEIYLRRFSDYLNSRGIKDIRDMDEVVISGFTQTFVRYSPSIIHNTLCSLRTFFHYLFQNGFISKNFAYIVPHDGYRQRTKVPSAYSKEEVEKLLKSIDRGNPKGKRNYAIILIAARLGLRAQDICNLSFDNLKWEINTIELFQEKTKKPIILPMLEAVGLAIIDCLKYARPECKSTKAIFLRLIPPIGKLEAPTLHSIVTQHMRIAGINIQDGKKHGPHALRHSLASALLEENTPLPIISEVLGHTNTESTSVYLKIDIKQLRTCSLEPLTFDWNRGEEVF